MVLPFLPFTLDRADRPSAVQGADGPLDCGYRNGSDRMVILRCCGPEQFYLERVVFPFEILTFQCPPETEVEVWTHGIGGPELLETLRIEDLLLAPSRGSLAPDVLSAFSDAAGGHDYQDSPWLRAG